MGRRFLAALGALALFGCGPSGRAARTGPVLAPKPADCAIYVALDGKIDRPYEVVGLVEAEGRDGVAELITVLQREACGLGADALLDVKQAVGSGYSAIGNVSASGGQAMGTSYSIYHLTATAVRYSSP